MNVLFKPSVLFILFFSFASQAQYLFSGNIDRETWKGDAYLSLVEDYRKVSGVYPEQIINRIAFDGQVFKFMGNNLDPKNRLYRIHIDNCLEVDKQRNHFNGACTNTQEILFIANNKDSIDLPLSIENQMFCSISSSNNSAKLIFKIDSLKEIMRYDYGQFRSETSRNLNNIKWFEKLQKFGAGLDEPLAELYIYNFLSDRRGDLYDYYLKDLASNSYYQELLERLKQHYPNTSYTEQYESEITSDRFVYGDKKRSLFNWDYALYFLILVSISLNIYFWLTIRNSSKKDRNKLMDELTLQEKRILELIIQEKSNKEIAHEVFVSLSTVKTHINNLYRKLGLQSRDELKKLFDK